MNKDTVETIRNMIAQAYRDLVKEYRAKKWDSVVYTVGYINGLCLIIDKDELQMWIYARFIIKNKWRKETTNAKGSNL